MPSVGRGRLRTMDRFWTTHAQRLLCGDELGEASDNPNQLPPFTSGRMTAIHPMAPPWRGRELGTLAATSRAIPAQLAFRHGFNAAGAEIPWCHSMASPELLAEIGQRREAAGLRDQGNGFAALD